jgi:hypothetical protein
MAAVALVLALASAVSAHNEHPLGREQIEWSGAPQVLRTLAVNLDFHGGRTTVSYRRNGRVQTRDGHECLVGSHFLFDIDDSVAFDIDETVQLELLFDRSASTGFALSYDHAVNPRAIEQRFEHAPRWQTVVLTLERARFANRKYEKTDLSIAAPNARYPTDSYQEDQEVAICGIKLTRLGPPRTEPAKGRLNIRVVNEQGLSATARLGLYEPDGRAPLAGDAALTISRYDDPIKQLPLLAVPSKWPSAGRYVQYVEGDYGVDLPAGAYQIVVTSGPEFRMVSETVRVVAAETVTKTIVLRRWRDLPREGWYSADDHIHIRRPDPSVNPGILAYMRAEDVHLANLLQAANIGTPFFRQYAFGARGHYVEDDYALASGQETPRTSHRGHTIGLNTTRFHYDTDDYWLYERTAAAIRADGGLFGYAHVALGAFHVEWGLALDVPLGSVDFIEVLQMGLLNTEYLYDFLNMGFRLLPSAGSDFPYIHVVGAERIYAQVDGEFSVQKWFDAWRGRRSFVSNAPIIEFAVNGDRRSNELVVAAGQTLSVHAMADVNPDFDELDRLELVVHGKVVSTAMPAKHGGAIELDHQLVAEQPLWFALRAFGKDGSTAHTAPVYVSVDGDGAFRHRASAATLARKYADLLEDLRRSTPTLDEEWERESGVEGSYLPKWFDTKPALDRRIADALKVYARIIDDNREPG